MTSFERGDVNMSVDADLRLLSVFYDVIFGEMLTVCLILRALNCKCNCKTSDFDSCDMRAGNVRLPCSIITLI